MQYPRSSAATKNILNHSKVLLQQWKARLLKNPAYTHETSVPQIAPLLSEQKNNRSIRLRNPKASRWRSAHPRASGSPAPSPSSRDPKHRARALPLRREPYDKCCNHDKEQSGPYNACYYTSKNSKVNMTWTRQSQQEELIVHNLTIRAEVQAQDLPWTPIRQSNSEREPTNYTFLSKCHTATSELRYKSSHDQML